MINHRLREMKPNGSVPAGGVFGRINGGRGYINGFEDSAVVRVDAGAGDDHWRWRRILFFTGLQMIGSFI